MWWKKYIGIPFSSIKTPSTYLISPPSYNVTGIKWCYDSIPSNGIEMNFCWLSKRTPALKNSIGVHLLCFGLEHNHIFIRFKEWSCENHWLKRHSTMTQWSCCVCTQPMREDITLYHHLPLAGRIHKMTLDGIQISWPDFWFPSIRSMDF